MGVRVGGAGASAHRLASGWCVALRYLPAARSTQTGVCPKGTYLPRDPWVLRAVGDSHTRGRSMGR